ncbi:MAG: hypothetical protein ACPG51_01515 [Thiolinea sp.]
MFYILLSVLCSTCILVIFRFGERIGANTRHIILVGYPVAAISVALIFSVSPSEVFSRWFIPAALEGIAFYTVFRFMAISAETSGISITGVASKMSVVVPVSLGILVLGETINPLIIGGIICGLLAIWLTVGSRMDVGGWHWPLLVFIGSGLVDASLKLFQVFGLTEPEFPAFLSTVFFFAFLFGLLHHLTYKERAINYRSVLAGIGLGLANLGSTYFVMVALAIPALDSVFVYSVNNFGVVILAVLVAVLIFREHITTKGWLGLLLAVASIVLLYKGYV